MDIQFDFEAELKKLNDKIAHAEANFGDTEVRDAIIEKADFLLKHERTEEAIKVYEEANKKSVGIGRKMDIVFTVMQIYFKQNELLKVKEQIKK